jgi:hypothetical protein
MRLYLYLVFFLLSATTGYGTAIKALPFRQEKAILKVDSSSVDVRHFDKAAIEKYKKSPEFQYKETVQDISLWTRFWRSFWHWFNGLFKFSTTRQTSFWNYFWSVIQILILPFAGAALVLFIFKAQGINLWNILRKKPTSAPVSYSEFFEDITVIDFDTELENAIAKANYRFAVRLLYLKCLKHLSGAGLIQWQIDKTNTAYIAELADKQQQAAFRQLTRQFEYVWYGELLIDQSVYNQIDSSFREFNQRVA